MRRTSTRADGIAQESAPPTSFICFISPSALVCKYNKILYRVWILYLNILIAIYTESNLCGVGVNMGVDRFSGVISVVVPTYNWPEALAAVLYGLANQTDRSFEVVVADDGSDHRTAEVVSNACVRAKHVWHEDRGFRVAEIRNRATLACKGEYVIFLDGDCIPRPNFVATHRRLAEPGYFVQGSRIGRCASLANKPASGHGAVIRPSGTRISSELTVLIRPLSAGAGKTAT